MDRDLSIHQQNLTLLFEILPLENHSNGPRGIPGLSLWNVGRGDFDPRSKLKGRRHVDGFIWFSFAGFNQSFHVFHFGCRVSDSTVWDLGRHIDDNDDDGDDDDDDGGDDDGDGDDDDDDGGD